VVSSLVGHKTGREAQEGLGREGKGRLGKRGILYRGKNQMYSKWRDNKMIHKKNDHIIEWSDKVIGWKTTMMAWRGIAYLLVNSNTKKCRNCGHTSGTLT
jgi:hypothetical protein